MRFYMVSPLVARETAKEVEIGGYLLPKVSTQNPFFFFFSFHSQKLTLLLLF